MNIYIKKWMGLAVACLLAMAVAGCDQQPAQTMPTHASTTVASTQAPTTEATTAPTEAPAAPLEMVLPMETEQTTIGQTMVFQGVIDPRYEATINGEILPIDENGSFTYEAQLEVGQNTFDITYLDETITYYVNRNYTTAWYAHTDGHTYCSGAYVYAELYAREGSKVSVTFRGKTAKVDPSDNQLASGAPEGFVYYVCRFKAPEDNTSDMNLGPLTYTVKCDDIEEVYTSGDIICTAAVEMKRKDPSVTPSTGDYKDVGSGYIVEIVDVNAETFNGRTIDDKSLPTMNYLPKGTVDYGSQGTYYNEDARRYYYLLRCGVRVYSRNDNKPLGMTSVVVCYNGYLPDHNEINVASFEVEGHHTYLTLDCLWKAPFFFNEFSLEPETQQWYKKPTVEYNVDYVDITFCYATVFTGTIEIGEDHPLFSKVEVIENEADYTLRLHLKQSGGLYGWSAYYNEEDQLVFRFLNPVTVSQADNAYGADLTGITVMLDVGHGGEDSGAYHTTSGGKRIKESERNLYLANLIKAELESIGATVVMNRTEEARTTTRTERISYLIQQAPDYCLCIHHNADTSSAGGFESWYFTSMSQDAAVHQFYTNLENDVYRKGKLTWNQYFLARQTACPVVLAENGYMTNAWELERIADNGIMQQKAEALVQGIANYYLKLSGVDITYEETDKWRT